MTGRHTRWVPSSLEAEDPERIAIRETLAFGKALYDRRLALGLSAAELAERAGMTQDDIECIEEGGTEPTLLLLRTLTAALDTQAVQRKLPVQILDEYLADYGRRKGPMSEPEQDRARQVFDEVFAEEGERPVPS